MKRNRQNLTSPPLKVVFPLLVAAVAFMIFLLQKDPFQSNQQTIYVFGTSVHITLISENEVQNRKTLQQIEESFHQFHQDWHAWEKGGVIGKINQAIQDQTSIKVADSVASFIHYSKQLAAESNYLFDPGIGSLVSLWGFHSEDWQGPPPSEHRIQNWLTNRPSIRHLQINQSSISSQNPLVSLDFGGNAKGLAIDMAMQIIQKQGIQHALVNIGGDMKAIGYSDPITKRLWRIGISAPQQPASPVASLALKSGESLVTSGNYQRYYEWQGQKFSHLLNPNTGYPANEFVSVTVLHSDATRADAAATALSVSQLDNWQIVAQNMQIQYAFLIDKNGKHHLTQAMQQRLDKR